MLAPIERESSTRDRAGLRLSRKRNAELPLEMMFQPEKGAGACRPPVNFVVYPGSASGKQPQQVRQNVTRSRRERQNVSLNWPGNRSPSPSGSAASTVILPLNRLFRGMMRRIVARDRSGDCHLARSLRSESRHHRHVVP